jgi:hypothetical protein
MTSPSLAINVDTGRVWRVGFAPDPWKWADWKYAQDDGRFSGRWDDELGQFRTVYTADSLYSCLIERLAKFRPDVAVEEAVLAIEDPDGDGGLYPDFPAGSLNFSWFDRRRATTAIQNGHYCYVTHSQSIAAIRAGFPALQYGIAGIDIDAGILKDAEVRHLTRSLARWLYEQTESISAEHLVDGIEFRSRHGDELRMWAIFERPSDDETTGRVSQVEPVVLSADSDEVRDALELHRITLV